jgi:hypothetical protein
MMMVGKDDNEWNSVRTGRFNDDVDVDVDADDTARTFRTAVTLMDAFVVALLLFLSATEMTGNDLSVDNSLVVCVIVRFLGVYLWYRRFGYFILHDNK